MLVGHSQDMDTYGVYSHEMDGDKCHIADKAGTSISSFIETK